MSSAFFIDFLEPTSEGALAIRRIFSLVDMIKNTKFSNCPNNFKSGVVRLHENLSSFNIYTISIIFVLLSLHVPSNPYVKCCFCYSIFPKEALISPIV